MPSYTVNLCIMLQTLKSIQMYPYFLRSPHSISLPLLLAHSFISCFATHQQSRQRIILSRLSNTARRYYKQHHIYMQAMILENYLYKEHSSCIETHGDLSTLEGRMLRVVATMISHRDRRLVVLFDTSDGGLS